MTSERRLFDDRRVSREGQKARLGEQGRQMEEQIKGLDVQQAAKAREIELIGKELEGQRRLFAQGLTSLNRVNSLDRDATRLEGERGALLPRLPPRGAGFRRSNSSCYRSIRRCALMWRRNLRDVDNQKAELWSRR